MKRLFASFCIAFSMYSRIPMPKVAWTKENKAFLLGFFPLVGLPIGLVCLGWNAIALALSVRDALRAAVLVLIPLAITGGIHLDGFLDTCDALSSWKPKEQRLAILKDPHAGAFAVICALAWFLLQFALMDALDTRMVTVYAGGFVLSRALSAISVVTVPKASAKGTVSGFAREANAGAIRIASILYMLLALGWMVAAAPVYALAALVGAGGSYAWYYYKAMKFFGGINGDLAGYFLILCETAMPLCMVVVSIGKGGF